MVDNLGDLLINEIHLRQTASPSGGEETVLICRFAYQERTLGAAAAVQGRTPCNSLHGNITKITEVKSLLD